MHWPYTEYYQELDALNRDYDEGYITASEYDRCLANIEANLDYALEELAEEGWDL